MRLLSPIFRPISKFNSDPPCRYHVHASHFTSAHETDISNSILSILHTANPLEDALERYVPSLSPNIVTSVIYEEQNPELGFRFFAWAMKRKRLRSWDSHNLVIDMLVRDNGFELFWETLEKVKSSGFPVTSPVFSVLIAGYAKSGGAEKAVESFGRMKDFDCQPDVFTYNTLLYILLQKEVFLLALAVYNRMLKLNSIPNQATFTILIDGLCKTGKTHDALQMFDDMTKQGIIPNTMTYTIILSGLCQAKRTDDAHRLLGTMRQNGCCPDLITYNALLNGFCKLGRIDEALVLLQSFQKEGYILGLNGYSCLIDGLFKAGKPDEAKEWYRKMIKDGVRPDVIFYTIMIRGFSEAGKLKVALNLLNEMTRRGLVPDTYCYNAVIKGFCDLGLLNKARSLQLEISKNDCFPNSSTYTILICGMCKSGFVKEAQNIFEEMGKLGCLPSVATFNALIDGLCKAGDLEEAHLLFYKMDIGRNPSLFLRLSQGIDRVLDSASLQSLVERLCESGLILKAYRLLTKLADSGVIPSIRTYNILINGYCKAKNINVACKLFKELLLKGLSPDSVTYGTLIDGFQRADREEDAFGLFDQMMKSGCIPHSAVYKSLMTWSCRKGKVSLSYSLWLKHLRNLPGREYGPIKQVEEHFERGEVEKAVRALLDMDFKLKDFELAPYTIWLIGLCQAGKPDEALKIFSILEEFRVSLTPPSCVALIGALCKIGNLDEAVDVFHYTMEKNFMLMPPICNKLLESLLLSEGKDQHAFDLLCRMESMGYDLDVYLYRKTKGLVHSHSRSQDIETLRLSKTNCWKRNSLE